MLYLQPLPTSQDTDSRIAATTVESLGQVWGTSKARISFRIVARITASANARIPSLPLLGCVQVSSGQPTNALLSASEDTDLLALQADWIFSRNRKHPDVKEYHSVLSMLSCWQYISASVLHSSIHSTSVELVVNLKGYQLIMVQMSCQRIDKDHNIILVQDFGK